jgi:hypothetical protein
MTPGRWTVAQNLPGIDDAANGVTVCGGIGDRVRVADCRGDVPRVQQLANARAVASLPRLLDVLQEVEQYLGDRPQSDRVAMALHRYVVELIGKGGAG